jgi:hypothetical protein
LVAVFIRRPAISDRIFAGRAPLLVALYLGLVWTIGFRRFCDPDHRGLAIAIIAIVRYISL